MLLAPSEERLWSLERDVRELQGVVSSGRQTLSRWTMAIVVAMIGAVVTVGGAGVAGSVAYGELRQQAATSERLLTELRGEIAEMRRDLHRSRDARPQ